MKSLLNKIRQKKAKVLIIGLGYVGWPLFNLIKKKGFEINGLDYNKKLIQEYKKNNKKNNLFYDYSDINFNSIDIIIIALPTPLKHKKPDLSYIKNSINSISKKLRENQLIILESTSYPSTTNELIVKKFVNKFKIGNNFFIGYSPEREDPGNQKFNIKNIPKIVSGKTSSCKILTSSFYKKVCKKVVESSSLEVAEMAKLYENIFRVTNISLSNETKEICKKIKIDFNEVLSLASTKPFGFMPFYPGPGAGGHCIPIDPFYLNWYLNKKNIKSNFIELAGKINSMMPNKIYQQIKSILKKHNILKNDKILILGMSYKKNIGDIRNSPSLEIFSNFLRDKYNIEFNDKYLNEFKIKNKLYKSKSIKDLKKYKSIILLTDHNYYKKLNLNKFYKPIIDVRNFFNKGKNIFKI